MKKNAYKKNTYKKRTRKKPVHKKPVYQKNTHNKNVHKRSALYWINALAILAFFVGTVVYLTTVTPGAPGDGHEYIMQTVAFQNHLSFGVSPEDFEEAKAQFYQNREGLYNSYTNPNFMAFDSRGWAYSNHFGAYSAIVTAVKLILLAFDIYPLWAFSITNLILWMAALLTVFFFLKTDDKRKFCILVLLMLNPVFFYLDWAHTEVYIFAFEVIGLVFLYNKQYMVSILAFSVSAMQNIGVLPMAAVAGLAYILDCYDRYGRESQDRNVFRFMAGYWKKIVPYGFLYLPAFCPMILSYLRLGTFNRVADIAMESKYLLSKAAGYLFDLNLGIFPYEPILLVLFFILAAVGIKRRSRDAILNLLGVAGIFYIIANQKQINAGMQGIMRYCVWIIPVMVFFVVMNWRTGSGKCFGLVAAAVAEGAFTAALVSYCVWFGGAYDQNQFSDWTKALIEVAPQLYNPTHGIFYSRTKGMEMYSSAMPIVYENEQGYVRKILLSKAAKEQFFADSFLLIDGDNNVIDKSALRGHSVDEGDYTYYNFTGEVRWLKQSLEDFTLRDASDAIYFDTEHYNADAFARQGISIKEDGGSWTDGKKVVLYFAVADASTPYVGVHIDVSETFYRAQSVIALINGKKVYRGKTKGDDDIVFTFREPGTDLIELTLFLPDAVSPEEVIDFDDSRKLGLRLQTLRVVY